MKWRLQNEFRLRSHVPHRLLYHMDCSPLDLDSKPMPMEAFRDLYHVPGFKCEYMNGRADISV